MTEQDTLAAKPRVLVVDDSRIVRALVRKHLANDYDIVEEADGEAAWRRLQSDPSIQLLVSDLSMPQLDGMGLIRRLRECTTAQLRALPVIVISGEEDEATRQQCVAAGANDFITKSTDQTEMQARVKANLELAATRRELEQAKALQAQTATTDAATGAATSHLLNLQLEQALALAQRHGGEVTLVLIEIDHFQPLAQRLGERLSTQLLNLLAKLIAGKLRREDTFARLDGALFAVISPASSLGGVRIMAERLRQAVDHARVNFRDEQLHVTASFALANSFCDQTDTAESLIAAAVSRLRVMPGENRLLMPDHQGDRARPLSLTEAMALLQQGRQDALRPHLPALLAGLLPLLELANDEMKLGWALENLRSAEER